MQKKMNPLKGPSPLIKRVQLARFMARAEAQTFLGFQPDCHLLKICLQYVLFGSLRERLFPDTVYRICKVTLFAIYTCPPDYFTALYHTP